MSPLEQAQHLLDHKVMHIVSCNERLSHNQLYEVEKVLEINHL